MPKMSFLVSSPTALQPNTDGFAAFHGSEFKGERLTVQFARGPRRKDDFGPSDRNVPRPRRTIYRMNITGLAPETSWQVSNIIFLYIQKHPTPQKRYVSCTSRSR